MLKFVIKLIQNISLIYDYLKYGLCLKYPPTNCEFSEASNPKSNVLQEFSSKRF